MIKKWMAFWKNKVSLGIGKSLRMQDWLIYSGAYFVASLAVAWLFYGDVRAALPLIIGLPFFLRYMDARRREKMKRELADAFCEMLRILAGELQVGYSMENAFPQTLRAMEEVSAPDEPIIRMLRDVCLKIRLHQTVEEALLDFSKESDHEDIRNFVTVFISAKRRGGDMISVIRHTSMIIAQKRDVEREVQMVMAAKRYEFHLMAVIPIGIIAYMRMSFPELFSLLYGNAAGALFMSGALVVLAAAYWIGSRIISIEM